MSVRDIAKLAGISASAVSLALRDSPKVSAATKQLVRRLAEAHGYRRSGKVAELMAQVRATRGGATEACLGVMSLYQEPRPWEHGPHHRKIYASMEQRAAELGYRLEPLWLRAPGMTPRRFRDVLDARGIQGLLCFGAPVVEQEFPQELDHFAIVTVGLSIGTELHRVTTHSYKDAMRAMENLTRRGYRRPGLVIHHNEEARSARAHVGAYLGWYDAVLRDAQPVPVLRMDGVEEQPLRHWLEQHQPDVVVLVHHHTQQFREFLVRHRIVVPQQVGVIALTHFVEGTGFAGFEQNQLMMGRCAVEMVVGQLMRGEVGIPSVPHVEMVESRWVDGPSLREPDLVPV